MSHPLPPLRSLLTAWLVAAAGLVAGCAGYRLGPTNGATAGSRSVEIRPFADKTFEPRLIEPVATAIRRGIQRDGTLRLVTAEPGDILVTGTLLTYVRNPLTLKPNDLFSTRDYEARLTAHVTAIDRSTARTLFDRDIIAKVPIRSVADLNSAERQAAPLLADDLARQVTSLLVDGSW